ncbi:MAG: hypothetical protein ACR2NN_06540 [Bryobacteraceae bacterium]
MSSSIASQWIPMPPPASSQSDRPPADASASHWNYTSGIEMIRPSDNVTVNTAGRTRHADPHIGRRYGFKPKLRVASGVSDVDVRRLAPFDEEEPISTSLQHCGHYASAPGSLLVPPIACIGANASQPGLREWGRIVNEECGNVYNRLTRFVAL